MFTAILVALPFVVNTPNIASAQTKPPTNTTINTSTPKTTPKVTPKTTTPKTSPTTSGSTSTACEELKAKLSNGGFNIGEQQLPEYCSTNTLYNKIIRGALYAVGIVAVIVIIYGGYMYMTAAGSDEQRKRGRTILTWAIVGLIVVILAVVLVNIAVKLLVEKSVV